MLRPARSRSRARRCAWAATSCPTRRCSANVDAPVTIASGRRAHGPDAQGPGARRPLRACAPFHRLRAGAPPGHRAGRERAAQLAAGDPEERRGGAPAAIVASCPTTRANSGSAWRFRSRAAPTRSIPTAPRSSAADARHAAALRPRVRARRAARRRRAAGRVDLHRQLHLSVGQRHRQGDGPRSASCAASTCSSARIRITTASATRSTATTSGTAPTTTRRRRWRCWRSAARCRRRPDDGRRCSSGMAPKSAD